MKLTVVNWNIHEGGIDDGEDTRLCRQLSLLNDIRPDVVMLQECKNWDESALRMAAGRLGMDGWLAQSNHHGCHLAVLIRQAAGLRVITSAHEMAAPYWHAVCRVRAEAEGLALPLYLASAHLAPSSPTLRLIEAEAFQLLARQPHLIAGMDGNALSVKDPDPPACEQDPEHVARKMDRRAAVRLDANLLDVGAYVGDFTPTVGHWKHDGLYYRCDGQRTTLPPEAVTGYGVIPGSSELSDHCAVMGEYDLSAA